MPERAREVIGRLAAGLMFFAILVLSMAQVPLEASCHTHHAHAVHQRVVATSVGSSAPSAPCSDHCDHSTVCCIASCTVATAALPPSLAGVSQADDNVVVYHAATLGSPLGAVPDPALRPPERVG